MNQLSNLNAKMIKEVAYVPALQSSATTIKFTVENCAVNAFVEQIIFYLGSADANFYNQVNVSLLDRGNGYTGQINGFNPVTFATIGTSNTYTFSAATASQGIVQNGNTVIYNVNQSVQDSEGVGNIYVQLSRTAGAFSVPFTMVVVYRPEITYSSKFNTRNQTSFNKYFRVLSQAGTGTYNLTTSTMTDQTKTVFNVFQPRNNVDTLTNGFTVDSNNPFFYFGLPTINKRWFIGFSSDNTPNIGVVTFSYFNGTAFTSFSTTRVFNGCQGPGTYVFAQDGVIIFDPSSLSWTPTVMTNDPVTKYNAALLGLGQTLATNNLVPNPGMYWIQCQVGFSTTGTLKISTVVPLIDPAQALTNRRPLI